MALTETQHRETLGDDESYRLPVSTYGWGVVSAGDAEEFALFRLKSDGTVTLVSWSGNVSDDNVDDNLCIWPGALGGEPAVKNRLGSSKAICVVFQAGDATDTVADGGEISLTDSVAGWGVVMAGDDEEFATFWVKDDGTVTLISFSDNVATSDAAGNLCIFWDDPASGGNGLVIKNNLGSSKVVNYEFRQGVSETVLDDGFVELPEGKHGWGFALAATTAESGPDVYALFRFDSSQGVALVDWTADVSDSDADGDLCIMDRGDNVVIANRLGTTRTIQYYYVVSNVTATAEPTAWSQKQYQSLGCARYVLTMDYLGYSYVFGDFSGEMKNGMRLAGQLITIDPPQESLNVWPPSIQRTVPGQTIYSTDDLDVGVVTGSRVEYALIPGDLDYDRRVVLAIGSAAGATENDDGSISFGFVEAEIKDATPLPSQAITSKNFPDARDQSIGVSYPVLYSHGNRQISRAPLIYIEKYPLRSPAQTRWMVAGHDLKYPAAASNVTDIYIGGLAIVSGPVDQGSALDDDGNLYYWVDTKASEASGWGGDVAYAETYGKRQRSYTFAGMVRDLVESSSSFGIDESAFGEFEHRTRGLEFATAINDPTTALEVLSSQMLPEAFAAFGMSDEGFAPVALRVPDAAQFNLLQDEDLLFRASQITESPREDIRNIFKFSFEYDASLAAAGRLQSGFKQVWTSGTLVRATPMGTHRNRWYIGRQNTKIGAFKRTVYESDAPHALQDSQLQYGPSEMDESEMLCPDIVDEGTIWGLMDHMARLIAHPAKIVTYQCPFHALKLVRLGDVGEITFEDDDFDQALVMVVGRAPNATGVEITFRTIYETK